MFDLNNFVIDHAIRGIMTNTKDGSFMWGVNQIEDPSFQVTTESNDKVDALGTVINTFYRGKKGEFTANNSLFDLGLYAAQNGNEKLVASEDVKIPTPCFEPITVIAGETSKVLSHTPIDDIKELHVLKGDGTFGKKYTASTSVSAENFVYADGEIKLPTGIAAGTELMVIYTYESVEAVAVTVDAINFPKNGRFIMDVLGHDVCDPGTLIHAYLILPNAKLDANVDINFTTEGNHPFTLIAFQDYCDKKKILCQLVIPNEA